LLSLNVQYNNGRDAVSTQGTGSGGNGVVLRSFTMPAANVTVTVYFVNPTYQNTWEAAKAIIEAAVFVLPQDVADIQPLRYRLADIINELIKSTGFVISPYDIVIFDYNFRTAIAGDAENRSGTNGYFEFRVTPPETRTSAYNEGTISATSYDDVANEQLTMNNEQLKAWVQNGVLYVRGLTPGKPWSIYNLYGQLIYTGIAVCAVETQCIETQSIASLRGRGIYIIQSANATVKMSAR